MSKIQQHNMINPKSKNYAFWGFIFALVTDAQTGLVLANFSADDYPNIRQKTP